MVFYKLSNLSNSGFIVILINCLFGLLLPWFKELSRGLLPICWLLVLLCIGFVLRVGTSRPCQWFFLIILGLELIIPLWSMDYLNRSTTFIIYYGRWAIYESFYWSLRLASTGVYLIVFVKKSGSNLPFESQIGSSSSIGGSSKSHYVHESATF